MNTQSNFWKKAGQLLALFVFAVSATGCGRPLPTGDWCIPELHTTIHTTFDPITIPGYITNHVVFTGLPEHISEVVDQIEVEMEMAWDVQDILGSLLLDKFTIRLYEWERGPAAPDAWEVAARAAEIANTPPQLLVAIPEVHLTTGFPASGSGGVEGGPGGGPADVRAEYHDFLTQWVLLENSGELYGISLIREGATEPEYIVDERGTGVYAGVFDTLPGSLLESDYYDEVKLCATALLYDAGVSVDYSHPANEHGYVAANEILLVSREANVHLVQTMGVEGGQEGDGIPRGNLITLLDAMSLYLTTYKNKPHHILNLSLGFELNFLQDLEQLDEPPQSAALEAFRQTGELITLLANSGSLQPINLTDLTPERFPFIALRTYLQHVGSQGHLVVAAAGNYGYGTTPRPDPMAPASLPAVLGVGSLNHEGDPSCFSNNPGDGGIWAPSGDGDMSCNIGLKNQCDLYNDSGQDCPYAIIVPFSDTYDGAYDSGYAHWVGTSFSAPLASGLAALIWGERDYLSPEAVKNLIESCQSRDVIDVKRTLEALASAPPGESRPSCSSTP